MFGVVRCSCKLICVMSACMMVVMMNRVFPFSVGIINIMIIKSRLKYIAIRINKCWCLIFAKNKFEDYEMVTIYSYLKSMIPNVLLVVVYFT